MANENIWPAGIEVDLKRGFSNDEIVALCDESANDFSRRRNLVGRGSWTTEIYGLGEAWRSTTGWPQNLPIAMTSDHGVTFLLDLQDHEKAPKYRFHLTWSTRKATRRPEGKLVFPVVHPWVAFRRKAKLEKRPDASGCLVIVDHSVPGDQAIPSRLDNYFNELMKLPARYRPTAFLVHHHDVAKYLHEELRRFNLPVFTLGHVHSRQFARRFYDLVLRYEFTTSSMLGTHTVLSEEAGVCSFLRGDSRIVDFSDKEAFDEDLYWNSVEMFSTFPPLGAAEKSEIVENLLGLEFWHKSSRPRLLVLFVVSIVAQLVNNFRSRFHKAKRRFRGLVGF